MLIKRLRTIHVGMGEWVVGRANDVLVINGLGSCVALVVWDQRQQVAVMCHVVLPSGNVVSKPGEPARFADQAVPWALQQLLAVGCDPANLKAKIAGGASLFGGILAHGGINVGERNVAAVRQALASAGIPLVAEDVGGQQGRAIRFWPRTGRMEVRLVNGSRTLIL